MEKILYGDRKNFYKANLHAHSTYSDGHLTPEEAKKAYMEHGYSIYAFTDHEYMKDQSHLTDENFLAINGYEVSFDTRRPGPNHEDYKFVVNYHLNFYKKTPDDLTHVFWNPKNPWTGDKDVIANAKYVGEIVDKKFDVDFVNAMIKAAHENNFLVSFNHPRWSMLSYEDYIGLEDLDFLEIYNTGCILSGNDDYVPQIYDEFLRKGKRLWCTATDDNHNGDPFDSLMNDSFGGWVVVNADKLDYGPVFEALENGRFYASTGGVIDKIVFEKINDNEGWITVKCGPARNVFFTTGTRNARYWPMDKKVGPLTEAYFKVFADDDYVRIQLEDMEGNHANSQAFFTDELFKD